MSGDSLPQWMQNFVSGWPTIRANIPTFITIIFILGGLIWAILSWSFGSVISHQAAEIKLLERQKAEAAPAPRSEALADRASLRLHIYGDTRAPDRISASNIWRWYHLFDVLLVLKSDGTKDREIMTSKLFISFDQPIGVGTMTLRADRPLPPYEVKEFNNRFAIVAFLDRVPECNLDIEVIP